MLRKKFVQPRLWKTLTPHPLCAEYPDLDVRTRQQMIANLEKFGIINERKITLHDGQILDGKQLFQCCLELGIKPEFQELPEGMTAAEYVEIVNDTRRHETQEIAIARAVARRERVLAARQGGESISTIAEAEGVSETTVRNDIAETGAEPAEGTVQGKDGRKTKPKTTPQGCGVDPPQNIENNGPIGNRPAPKTHPSANKPLVLCARCQRVGQAKDCPACEALRSNKKNGAPKFDCKAMEEAIGKVIRLIDDCGRAHGKRGEHTNMMAQMGVVVKTWKSWQEDIG